MGKLKEIIREVPVHIEKEVIREVPVEKEVIKARRWTNIHINLI